MIDHNLTEQEVEWLNSLPPDQGELLGSILCKLSECSVRRWEEFHFSMYTCTLDHVSENPYARLLPGESLEY